MRPSLTRTFTTAAAAVFLGAAATVLGTTTASAESTAIVTREITAHGLPYLSSPYIIGSTLRPTPPRSVQVACKTRGREFVGGSVEWYRIDAMYYPAYAFYVHNPDGIPPCGVATVVPFKANGYSDPSFLASAAENWFSTNEDIRVLCTAMGDEHLGSHAWFFTKGYWLHSTRIADSDVTRYGTCRGYATPTF